jgi:hypothetical protein
VEHVDELIAGHALRALSSEDEERVVVHLAECDQCRRKLRETEAVAASLAYGVPQVAPPPELRRRVLAISEPVVAAPAAAASSARPQRTPARRGWWPRFAAVAVPVMALALVGLLAWNVSLRNDVSANRDNLANGAAVMLPGVGNVVAQTDGNATLFASLRPAPAGKNEQEFLVPLMGMIDEGFAARRHSGQGQGGALQTGGPAEGAQIDIRGGVQGVAYMHLRCRGDLFSGEIGLGLRLLGHGSSSRGADGKRLAQGELFPPASAKPLPRAASGACHARLLALL